MRRKGCAVATVLTAQEYSFLAGLELGANELEWFAWCELEPGHSGEWHYALGQSAGDSEWWLRWRPTARELVPLANCDARTERLVGGEREPCMLFSEHPGNHDFAYAVSSGPDGVRPPALTVGDVRRAWHGLPDDTPIRIGAIGSGVLAETTAEVLLQAVGEGTVDGFTEDGDRIGPRPAAVLLAGLNVVSDAEGKPLP